MSNLKHVAIIMDGNGRWAQKRAHRRVWGHIRGAGIVTDIIEEADALGLKALTLYAFSSENWSRPLEEVSTLMKLLKKFLLKERKRILKNNVQFKVIGTIENLPDETKQLIEDLEKDSLENTGLKLNFAFGYGSRMELTSAINRFIQQNPGKDITESKIEEYLFTSGSGDVDLMIRTGGDQRISNFLLWQSAYAELFFTNTPWPEFSVTEFREIIEKCSTRERRFGGVGSDLSLDETVQTSQINKEKYESSHRKGSNV